MLVIACAGSNADAGHVRQAGYAGADSIEVVDGDTAHIVDSDDWELASARRDAQATFGEFVRRFRDRPSTQTDLMVKARFAEILKTTQDSAVEHLWITPLVVAEHSIRGILENTPFDLRRVKYRDTVTVDVRQVSDWYAIDRDTLVGGFTIRLFRSRLTQAGQDSADRRRSYAIVGTRLDEYRRLTKQESTERPSGSR